MKEMLLALLLLIIGFVLLIKGADFFVDGSSSVAKKIKSTFNDNRTYNCSYGYKSARMCS